MGVVVRGGSVVRKGFVRLFCARDGEARLRRGVRGGCVGKLFLGVCQVWANFEKMRGKVEPVDSQQSDRKMMA